MKDDEKLLVVEDLTKIFTIGGRLLGSKLVAVNKVNFEIKQGCPEILTLAGESGSGKTTFGRIALGLIEPTRGRILYKGNDVRKIRSRKERLWFMKEVQPIFQNPFETFNPLKRVDSYLYETATNYGVADNKKDMRVAIDESLTSVGLSPKEIEGKYPHELSGGEVQRVSIARALINRPFLLIADEPVSMVDASIRMSIINLFKELKEKYGISIIYITHDLATAYYISDRIAIMLRGNIVEFGPIEKVLLDPLHPYTEILLESVPKSNPDKRWKGEIKLSVLEAKEFTKLSCKFSDRCPYSLDICQELEPENVLVDDRIVRCHRFSEKYSRKRK